MKKEYQLYKRHHNDKFIGWGVGYEYRGRLIELATFYGRKAKEYAEHFIDVLEFDRA